MPFYCPSGQRNTQLKQYTMFLICAVLFTVIGLTTSKPFSRLFLEKRQFHKTEHLSGRRASYDGGLSRGKLPADAQRELQPSFRPFLGNGTRLLHRPLRDHPALHRIPHPLRHQCLAIRPDAALAPQRTHDDSLHHHVPLPRFGRR